MQWFQNFRLKDLTWGVNLRDYPSEIEDIQALIQENWNFDWNKLINSQSYKEYELNQAYNIGSHEIRSVDIIDQDVYITHYGNLLEITKWVNNIWLNGDNNIHSWFWNIPWTISAWQTYGVTITWVGFGYWPIVSSYVVQAWDTKDDVYAALVLLIIDWSIDSEVWSYYATPSLTQVDWLFIWAKNNAWRIDISDTWVNTWDLVLWQFSGNVSNPEIIKSWDDLILIADGWTAQYYQNIWGWDALFWVNMYNGTDPIKAKGWVYYNGKFVYFLENSNVLYFSKTSTPSEPHLVMDFTTYSAWAQRVWWDGNIAWLIVWENWLYIFKEDEIWYSNSETDTWTSFNFNVNKITNNWAKDKACITKVEQDIFYYDGITKKVRRLSYEQNLTTLRDTAVSDEVDEWFNNQDSDIDWIQQKLYYCYPNLRFATVEEWWTPTINDIIYCYNVDEKSWIQEPNKNIWVAKWCYFSLAGTNWKLYEDNDWWTTDWTRTSKEYAFIDEVDYVRGKEVEVIWDITWIWGTKNLEIEILADWVALEIWTGDNPTKRIVSAATWVTNRFREKIDLFDDARVFQFKLTHEWDWYVEVSSVNFIIKPLKVSQSNYY